MKEMLERIIANRKSIAAYDEFQMALHYPEFGLSKLIDWDNEARTAIEGVNSAHVGGIDRSRNPMWRTMVGVNNG
jgi:hypothetical protein